MDNSTRLISESELQEALRGHVVALVLLGVVLLVTIALGAVAIYLLYRKLKQHEDDILSLQDIEKGPRSREIYETKDDLKKNSHGDSAIEMGSTATISDNDSVGIVSSLSRHQSYSSSHMSVVIRHEKANVYGCTPHTSQLIMTAQDYYKSLRNTDRVRNTDCVVPSESVKVSEKHKKNLDRASNLFTDDWRHGRTTSMLLDSLGNPMQDNVTNNKALFIHKTVDNFGGHLEVSGVKLSIPKGALDKPTLITLGIVWEENLYPILNKKKCLLSPVVLCQPSGLKFNVPVRLTFPHCAVNVNGDWNITILKRTGDLCDSVPWTEVGFDDFSERDINANTISVTLNHFTLYTCVGESCEDRVAAKSVHLVAFVSQLTPGSIFKPRVYCINNYKEEFEEVQYITSKMVPGSKISETSDLIVHDNEQDLVVKLDKLSEKWKLHGEKTEVLSFEQVWHGLAPHVTFLIKPQDSIVNEIYCEFICYQQQREKQRARLKIAEEKRKSMSPLSPCTEYPQQELINQIIIHLDPSTVGESGDWRDLAEKLGCDMARIKWLATQSSPTRLLIDMWLDESHDLAELADIMIEIKRPDVADEIRSMFPLAE